MMPSSRANTAIPTPMPAFAPVLSSVELASAFERGGVPAVDSLGDGVAVPCALADIIDVLLAVVAGANVLSVVDAAEDAEDAADVLVDAATSLPTVAASVNNRELVLQ